METNSLLCDEELPPSPYSSPAGNYHPENSNSNYSMASGAFYAMDDVEWEHQLRVFLQKQQSYLPRDGYLEFLRCSSGLSSSRLRAVRWIIMARSRLNLAISTVFFAVNYLDRFISMYLDIEWECWMIELLSIACLSIAAKFEEVDIPSLHDIQTEDLDHSFQRSTIQRMELVVLKALDWQLNSVTAHSFVDLLTWGMDSSPNTLHHIALRSVVTARTSELLISAISDITFLEFNPCTLALSTLKCSLEELIPRRIYHGHLSHLAHLLTEEHVAKEMMSKCQKSMEELVVGIENTDSCPLSPVTVIPTGRTEIFDCGVDIDVIFKVHANSNCRSSYNLKKRRMEVASWPNDDV